MILSIVNFLLAALVLYLAFSATALG